MKPAILVAVLFRTLDAFRIFDSVFVQTRGPRAPRPCRSWLQHPITRLNLGLGSAVSVHHLRPRPVISFLFVKGFGADLAQQRGEA